MSRPCAQVSMIRADAIVPAPIGGPSHVSRVPDGHPGQRVEHRCTARPPAVARPRTSVGRQRPPRPPRSQPADRATMADRAARKPSGSRQASTVSSSVQVRCPIWCAIVQPAAGVAVEKSTPDAETSPSRSAPSAARSASTAARAGREPSSPHRAARPRSRCIRQPASVGIGSGRRPARRQGPESKPRSVLRHHGRRARFVEHQDLLPGLPADRSAAPASISRPGRRALRAQLAFQRVDRLPSARLITM